MRECSYCEKEIPYHTEHLVSDVGDEHVCPNCFETYTTTYFYIGGEYAGSDDEGNYAIVYDWEDEEESE